MTTRTVRFRLDPVSTLIPIRHVAVGALEAARMGLAVEEIVAELMRQREVAPPRGPDGLVVYDAPLA